MKADLLAFALALPEAWEDHPWGESVAKVGKKVFVFFGMPDVDEGPRFTVKLRESHEEASALGWTADPGYGLGRGGWLTVNAPRGRTDRPPPVVDPRELSGRRAEAACRHARALNRA